MHDHLLKCLEAGELKIFPKSNNFNCSKKTKIIVENIKLNCIYKQPTYTKQGFFNKERNLMLVGCSGKCSK